MHSAHVDIVAYLALSDSRVSSFALRRRNCCRQTAARLSGRQTVGQSSGSDLLPPASRASVRHQLKGEPSEIGLKLARCLGGRASEAANHQSYSGSPTDTSREDTLRLI